MVFIENFNLTQKFTFFKIWTNRFEYIKVMLLIEEIIFSDNDLKAEVDACLELPPTYNTVVRRAQLAQQICEMGREELKMCEKLVHEQHLQHQGWTAVIANMEDITVEFEKKAEDYMKIFEEHMERRTAYKDYLEK